MHQNKCVIALGLALFLPVFQAGASCEGAVDDDLQALELQLKCEEYRQTHFHAGFMKFVEIRITDDGQGGELSHAPEVVSVWFNNECLRNDVVRQNQDPFQGAVCDEVYVRALDNTTSVTVAPAAEYGAAQGAVNHLGLCHPRWIGMGFNSISSLSRGRQSRCLRLREGLTEPVTSLDLDSISGIDAWRIEYRRNGTVRSPASSAERNEDVTTKEGESSQRANDFDSTSDRRVTSESRHVFWIAPSQGYALLRCELDVTYPETGNHILASVDSSYAADPESGIWYPENSTMIVRNGQKIASGRRIIVEKASFVAPPKEAFTLAGLSLPSDRRVSDRTKGPLQQEFFWDGSKAVHIPSSTRNITAPLNAVVPEGASGRRWLLLGNAAVLVAIGIYLLWSSRRRKRHTA